MNLARLRNNSPCSARIHRATAIGVVNRMETHNWAFHFMFLLLTYLLFRRPASATSKRLPTELNFKIGHPVNLRNEAPANKSAQSPGRNGASMSFLRGVAPGLALIPLLGVFAVAQAPADAQARLAAASDVSRSGRDDKGDKK